MNVILIGMPGAGKSCFGKILSKKLGMKFLDGDKLIEKTVGKKLHEIIDEEGIENFKKIEEQVLLSIEEDGVVIAPGGSAIYYDSVMNKFKKNGIVVYLYASSKTITERLGDFSMRGIVLDDGKSIEDLYHERVPLFKKYADYTVNCDGKAYSRYKNDLLRVVSRQLEKTDT